MKRYLPTILAIGGLILFCLGSAYGLLLFLLAAMLCPFQLQPTLFAFPNNCNGRIINVSPSNGCTLTRADILGMTPNMFEAQGFTEIGMDKVYANLREARLAGYREHTLQALLMSRVTNIKGQLMKSKISPSESVILPYISRRQKRNINSNYWSITFGGKNPQAGQSGTPIGAWDLTVTNSPSPLANTLQNLDQYFLPGKYMVVEYQGANGTAYSLYYRILAAATVAGVCTVTVAPNYSDTGWLALSAAQQLPYQIGGATATSASRGAAQAGAIAYLGVNSVSDFESWGGQDVAENTNSLIHFFLQTSRLVHEYTDEYLRALNDALTSNYFKIFRQLPLAEQKRIQQAKYDRDMLNAAFEGQQINENQTVEGYRNLPQVVDPANPNCVLEYKSNALGFRTLLNNCGRILDHQNNQLNLDTLLQTLYLVMRAREADGTEVKVIDCMTDRFTAGMILDIMVQYYKQKYGVTTTRFYEPGKQLIFENQVELEYNLYQLPPEFGGYQLAVFTHKYFDDKIAASGGTISAPGAASGANRQRRLWFLDWTDIELGVAGTNSAVRRTNEADQLYNYVIRINAKHITLNSMTWTPIIEDPNRHYIVENFDGTQCPKLTVSGCTIPVVAPQ